MAVVVVADTPPLTGRELVGKTSFTGLVLADAIRLVSVRLVSSS